MATAAIEAHPKASAKYRSRKGPSLPWIKGYIGQVYFNFCDESDPNDSSKRAALGSAVAADPSLVAPCHWECASCFTGRHLDSGRPVGDTFKDDKLLNKALKTVAVLKAGRYQLKTKKVKNKRAAATEKPAKRQRGQNLAPALN